MKKLFRSVAVAAILFVGSCQKYDDSTLWGRINDLENRVTQLEELCKQMNTNIASLPTIVSALQNNDYVTGVVPVVYNGETIGYTITFAKSTPITIYHGQNGKDGKDGVNGNGPVPVIGVRQDTDGVYYWTLDGDWLTDENGDKIKANGEDGKQGPDGKDGTTPQLKIEEGYWYVSTDNGATWTKLGKATGEDGADSGDSIFESITQDDENIYFALKNGETIVLPKKQQLAIMFAEGNSLQFDVNETKIVHYTITGARDKTIVNAELQNPDGNYALYTTPASATEGTIAITAKTPETENSVIVTVSDGSQTVTAKIIVSTKAGSTQRITITVETPGSLWQLLAGYDISEIIELTLIGNLGSSDMSFLKVLPNLAVLDMERVNLEELSADAFREKQSLTSIKLPLTLKTIGGSAFSGCSSLTNITIPDGVTSIGNGAFCYCRSLTSITIPDSVTTIGIGSVVEYGTFAECHSLTSVTIGNSVTTIGCCAFCYCSSLTSVTIGSSVTTIEGYAFLDCRSLTSVTIPDSVTSIGSGAFEGCSNLSAFYGKLASSDNRCLIVDGCLTAFAPAGLTSYTIPDSVTEIGSYAFQNCSSLTSVTIGSSVTTIGGSAFSYCSRLTSVTIPDSVTEIGSYAFQNCSSLTSIYCKAQTPPSVETSAFWSVSATLTLYVPIGCKEAYAATYGWNEFKTIIETQF